MDSIGIIGVAVFALVLVMLMAGRKVTYRCNQCDAKWKGTKHHGSTAPSCPECGSRDISRK